MPVSLPVTQAFRNIERKESGIDAARCLMTGRPDEQTWQRQSLTANRRVRYFFHSSYAMAWLRRKRCMDDLKVIEKMRLKAEKAFSIFIFPLTRSSHSSHSPPKVQGIFERRK